MEKPKQFPPQQLPISRKNIKWGKSCVDWAKDKTFFNYQLVRKSVIHKKINYDLVNGQLHMDDVMAVLNPDRIEAGFIPDEIQHYALMNSKLNVLRGEETSRLFDFRVVVTNPNAISEIEERKKQQFQARVIEAIANTASSREEFEQEMNDIQSQFTYNWQDVREIRGNCLVNHYIQEYNLPLLFNTGFMDAMTVGEEIYQVDIVGGEPVVDRINPLKIRVFRSGYSNKIEDADIVILEDYWNPGKILDNYYDVLSAKDIKKIEEMPYTNEGNVDSMDNLDERNGYLNLHMLEDTFTNGGEYFNPMGIFSEPEVENLMPYDLAGNIRVLRVYWKSKRKIKRVKQYDPETGEEIYNIYDESYVINELMGEEEEVYYVNQAWEGTLIGEDIYVNIRPRPVQYNRLDNPSRCHFGIIGSVYNLNEDKPFSLVDMMKPYNYLYDVLHDRLNKLMAKNWGKIIKLDLAMVPESWKVDQWMYFAKTNNIAVVDSFKEGNKGQATGKLAGALNNNSNGVIDAELGNSIQMYLNTLEYIQNKLSDIVGISKQREGQVSNRETVGGVERATLQSSYITEWWFTQHEDVKRRVLECLLETAKIALKGRTKKFQYLLSDQSIGVMEIDGDEFAECDYGLIVDNSKGAQELNQKLDTLAQAALQNQALSFSAIMKLYSTKSLAEKQRMIEEEEKAMRERAQQEQQQQMQLQQQQLQLQAQWKEKEMQLKDSINQRDNETKVMVAELQSQGEKDLYAAELLQHSDDPTAAERIQAQKDKIAEDAREFDAQLAFNKEKLRVQEEKNKKDIEIKQKQLNKK